MQVLEFPNRQPEQPAYPVHLIAMPDRIRDMRIVHNLPGEGTFKEQVTDFHLLLDDDNPLKFLLNLSFREYLNDESFTHDEVLKYRLGIVVARIVVNTQLVERYGKSIASPEVFHRTVGHAQLGQFATSQIMLPSFYESDDHPEHIKQHIRQEVGHIISPEPETEIDWFAVGMGDSHAALSHMLGENLELAIEPINPNSLPAKWRTPYDER